MGTVGDGSGFCGGLFPADAVLCGSMDGKIHFRGGMPCCRDAIHRVHKGHWRFYSMYIPADAMNRVPTCGWSVTTCDNDIAILTQFAFGPKMYYLCSAKVRGRCETVPFFVLEGPFQGDTVPVTGFFRCLVVFRRSHVGISGPACRQNYKACTLSGMCMKVKNVNVGHGALCGCRDGQTGAARIGSGQMLSFVR